MGRTAGTEAYRWDSTGCPSLSAHPLGTEGWDGQLGQRPTDGTPRDVPHCPYVPWGLRDGTDSWDRGLQMGLHGISLTVHTSLGDSGMGRTAGTEAYRWDFTGCLSLSAHPLGTEGLDGQLGQRPTDGTPWDVPHCPYIPWGLRDGTDSWDRGLQMGLHGMSLTVRTSLGDLGMGRTAVTEAYRWDSTGYPSLSIRPLGTEGWDGQLGQGPVIGDSMGCPSLSLHPLGTEGWDGQL